MNSKILLIALLAIIVRTQLYAQANCTNPPNCINNPGLNPPTGVSLYPNGTPINNSSFDGWSVLTGTPIVGPGVVGTNGFQMVSDVVSSEGMYTCYNFQAGRKYKVCLKAYNTTSATGGSLILEAHNGSTGQTIANNIFYQSGPNHVEFSYTFTAYQNFTQLRIFTNRTPNAGNPYSVVVDDVGVIEIPSLTATPSTISSCGSTTLKANSANPLNITWSPSTGLNTTSGATVIARPCSTQVYTASYSANCLVYGCTNNTEQITVNVQPGTNVTASPSTINGCGSTTLTATSANPMMVTWLPAPGLVTTTGNVVTARPCSTTTYTARFTCANGCNYTKQVTVNVQPGTNVTASPSTISVCQSATLTASSTNAMDVTWSPAAGLNTTRGNVVIASPCTTTTYTATYYCPQTGCSYTDNVTVYVQPNGSIVDNSPSDSCYSAIDLAYVSNSCPGNTYKWFGPRNPNNVLSTSSTLYMPTSTQLDQGMYMLIVTTSKGCIDTFYASVVKNCCKVAVDFEMVGVNPVRFINHTTSNGTPILQGEWYWDFGDGATSSLRNPSHLYPPMATYKVCLTAVVSDNFQSTCCDKVCKEFDIPDRNECEPKAAFDYRVVNAATGAVQFIDKSATAGTACGWIWKVNGAIQSTVQNPTIMLGSGMHHICLEVTNCSWFGHTCTEEWCEDIIIP